MEAELASVRRELTSTQAQLKQAQLDMQDKEQRLVLDREGLKWQVDRFERELVLRVLEQTHWNQSRAARHLGLHRNSLKVKLAGWGIRPTAPGL